MVGGPEFGGGAEELLGVQLIVFREHQTEVEIGFEHVRLGGDGLPVGGDRVVGLSLGVVEEAEIKPGLVVPGVTVSDLFE